jgi:hypothetical protein
MGGIILRAGRRFLGEASLLLADRFGRRMASQRLARRGMATLSWAAR